MALKMASNVKQSPIPVVPRNLKMVNADGTPTRSGQLLLEQLQAPSATAGTHGDRPNPGDVPEGSLWYENDRGVLYASTLGVWQYVAGTMYGTLSPVDERPTDLGTHDAGFDFRTIVAPAREFLWSQAAWIEVTPVQYGPHSARPDPTTIVQGALYVEGDRGGVIYQVENPAGTNLWQYLAGTMWGTLSPDQRPTGLGTHDAGFDFRSTDPPPREFIWNQTAWVETAQDNLLQYAAATGNLTLSTSFANVPGATLTLTRAGRYLVTATVCFVGSGSGDFSTTLQFQGQAQLVADGVAQTALADTSPLMASASLAMILTVYQQWSWQATAPGKVLQLQGNKTGGTGGSIIFSRDTSLSALWVSP